MEKQLSELETILANQSSNIIQLEQLIQQPISSKTFVSTKK
jgi:hypothetical protein